MLRNIRYGIKNIIKWFPVIWNDRDWDYRYIYEILHKKLELKEQFFRSDKTHVADWEQTADEIKEVKDALKRLIDDDYVSYEEVMKDAKTSLEKERKLTKEDMDTVFNGMKNNIQKWWD